MNLVTLTKSRVLVCICAAAMGWLGGCDPQMPTSDELAVFAKAGAAPLKVDLDSIVQARIPSGPYRIVPGDLLNIHIPFLSSQSNEVSDGHGMVTRRVDAEGKVILPMIDQISLGGKTLMEAEAAIGAAYYPQHIVNRPAVVVQMAEYDGRYVEITGGVANPGRYLLRTGDEMSLVTLLMRSGNIIPTGAAAIRVTTSDGKSLKPVVVPVKGLNMPFADVALKGGDASRWRNSTRRR